MPPRRASARNAAAAQAAAAATAAMPAKATKKTAATKAKAATKASPAATAKAKKSATKKRARAAVATTTSTTTTTTTTAATTTTKKKSAAALAAEAATAATDDGGDAPPAKKKAKTGKDAPAATRDDEYDVPEHPASQDDYATPYGAIDGYAKLLSWNVNGINAFVKNGGPATVEREAADIVCLQETKLTEAKRAAFERCLGERFAHVYWNCCTVSAGKHGTAVFSRIKPLRVEAFDLAPFDGEGRVLVLYFARFALVNTYVPNSGMKLERLAERKRWDAALLGYLRSIVAAKTPIVWTGDLNVAQQHIDLALPKQRHNKVPGATDTERAGFAATLAGADLVDLWRARNADTQHYTFWSYKREARLKNTGWRLDYFAVSSSLVDTLGETWIRSKALGSDHVPIGVLLPRSLVE